MRNLRNKTIQELDKFLYIYTDENENPHLISCDPSTVEEERRLEFETDFIARILARCGCNYTDKNHPIQVWVQFKYKGETTTLPNLYLATNDAGNGYLFTARPSEIKDGQGKKFSINLVTYIMQHVGSEVSPDNPVKIRANFRRAAESKPFCISDLSAIQSGQKKCHFEDGEGAVVIIIPEQRHEDDDYILVGKVYDPLSQECVTCRFYNTTGECFDKNEAHNLEIVAGWPLNKKPENAK